MGVVISIRASNARLYFRLTESPDVRFAHWDYGHGFVFFATGRAALRALIAIAARYGRHF